MGKFPVTTWHLVLLLVRYSLGCTVWRMGSAGLASGVGNLFTAFPIFYGTNGHFYIDNRDNPYSCTKTDGWENGWHDFFITDDVLNWKPEHERDLGNVCKKLDTSNTVELVQNVEKSYDSLQVLSVLKLWKLKPWVQERVNAVVSKALEQPRPTIGFHMRGGDKLQEDKDLNRTFSRPEEIVLTFKHTWPRVKGGTCIIVGDDAEQVKALSSAAQKRIGCRIHLPHEHRPKGGHLQKSFNQQSIEDRCTQTIELLSDIEVLAHTDYMVGSYNSGIPGLVEILRYALYGKSRLTFADASLKHRDWGKSLRNYLRRLNIS